MVENQVSVTPEAACLAVLFVAFPSGVNEPMKGLYLEQLQRRSYAPEVLAEAAQRIIATREQRSVPPLAEIIRRCDETRGDFLKAQAASESPQIGQQRWKPTPEYLADARAYRRLVLEYGVYWCRADGKFVQPDDPRRGCGHDPETEEGALWRPGEAVEALQRAESQGWRKRGATPESAAGMASLGSVVRTTNIDPATCPEEDLPF